MAPLQQFVKEGFAIYVARHESDVSYLAVPLELNVDWKGLCLQQRRVLGQFSVSLWSERFW